jgi:hypothetical protein
MPAGQGLGCRLKDDHFGGTQQDSSAPAVRNELGWRKRLAAVGLEEQRQTGQRRTGGGCCSCAWRGRPGGERQDQ